MENEEIAEERIGASSDRVRGQPVRLVWMVNQIDHQLISDLAKDPVHLAWTVN